MKRFLKPLAAVLLFVVVAAITWRALAPRADERPTLSGYVEGDDLYLAAPIAGAVTRLNVVEGQRVAAGAALFTVDPAATAAQREQILAQGRRAGSEAETALREVRQAEANVAAAKAQEEGSRLEFQRLSQAAKQNPQAVTGLQIDQSRTALQIAEGRRRAAEAEATVALKRVETARTAEEEAAAALQEVDVRLGQLAQRAPSAGRVETVFLQPGEWATPNQPVLSLLPDGKLKLRFYVPEADVGSYRPGKMVSFDCDGCRDGLRARITRVGQRPEFTPPVIYSRKTRDRLVFLVEALPNDPGGLAPGQPIDVEPLAITEARG